MLGVSFPVGRETGRMKNLSITNKAKESCAFHVTAQERWLWPLGLGVKTPHFAPHLRTAPGRSCYGWQG